MIGVLVHPAEQEAVREFFELLKTPWEFCQEGINYDVLLATVEPARGVAAPLRLLYGSAALATDRVNNIDTQNRPGGATLLHGGQPLPVYGPVTTFPAGDPGLLEAMAPSQPALLAWRTGEVTVVRVGYNLFAEIRTLLTQGQPAANAHLATLEMHLALLRDLITRAGMPLVEIPPVPAGHGFIACLTHDIDHPVLRNHFCDSTMLGFIYRATLGSVWQLIRGRISAGRLGENWLAAARLPLVYLGVVRDFWRDFDGYVDLESGRPSTFFVIPAKGHAGIDPAGTVHSRRACRYSLSELTPQLNRIRAAGSEISLHGLDAWREAAAGRREQARLEQQIGSNERGVRMHWLYFNQDSPTVLEAAGFSYDSSVGYNETAGYRAGTTQAYRPLGVRHLLELPLHVMDTALFYPDYLNLREEDARRLVGEMMEDVAGFGGVLTINWHDRSIAPERLWGNFYQDLLGKLGTRRAWFATAADTVGWFRMRRSATVLSVETENGKLKIRSRLTTLDTRLPGLMIRVHKPHVLFPGQTLATGSAAGFVDAPLDDTVNISISQ